jgi:hypothetical protein
MSDDDAHDIEEFHANRGKVDGGYENKPLLLLHHIGAHFGSSASIR